MVPMQQLPTSGTTAPAFIYGTAWKEERTRALVLQALRVGFRAIDTANQRKHYFEAAVGEALAEAIGAGLVTRDELFLQTKFTHRPGQDHRLPYDPSAPMMDQVRQSFASSLEHLGVERIDSYVLHGPSQRHGLAPEDWEAWRGMEELAQAGQCRVLGVSNVSAAQLAELVEGAAVRPSFVQNRCYAVTGWDWQVRRLCEEHGVAYQGFSLLTANVPALRSPAVTRPARRVGATSAAVVFRFAQQVEMIPLTGSSSAEHLAADLACGDFELTEEEVRGIEGVGV